MPRLLSTPVLYLMNSSCKTQFKYTFLHKPILPPCSRRSYSCPVLFSYCFCDPTNLVAYNHTNLLSYKSVGQKSKLSLRELKSKCWPGWVPPEAQEENLSPYRCQLLETATWPAWRAFPYLLSQQRNWHLLSLPSASTFTFPSLNLTFHLLFLRTLVITLGPSR